MDKIELLAPAGDLERLKIAIMYGADAVFIGGKRFSLRSRASNFEIKDIENLLIGLRDNLPRTKVVLVSLTSMSMEWGRKNQLAAYNNVKIKLLAEKYGFSYVDLYSALLDLETGEICAAYTTDGGHQTAEGYEVFTANITPVVTELLNQWGE